MKCHYEILNVPMNATSDEIKKAYRKLALEWHPDKNLHRSDEAKETFQLLQQAYEILSDPQERAWYDRHRDDILQSGGNSELKDDSLDVYQFFNTGCFKGYGDDDKSFYFVYRDVFDKIASEDKKFIDESDVDIPSFGYSYSPYEEVHAFYAYWQSYCTAKSYSWVDKHDLTELRRANVGRQVLRAIEKENKKLRDQHKKIRNEEVRQLVSFVRKRDKRVRAHQKLLEEQSAEKAKKFEEMRKQQILDRQRDLQKYQEMEWASMAQFEATYNEIEANLDSASMANGGNENDEDLSDPEEQDLYCVACDKDFRSLKSMKNHENSKKHKENVELLKVVMQEEEREILGQNASDVNDTTSTHMPNDENDKISEEEISEEELPISEPVSKRSGKKKKKKKVLSHVEENHEVVETLSTDLESKMTELSIEEETGATIEISNDEASVDTKKEEIPQKKGKKLKEAKKKAKLSDNSNTSVEKEKQSTFCEKCGKDYHSRNKLFQHLKETGHAVYLGDGETSKKQKNSSRKGNR